MAPLCADAGGGGRSASSSIIALASIFKKRPSPPTDGDDIPLSIFNEVVGIETTESE